MSNINDLPDDLLVKILSHIPTKDVVATSLLSKRWKFLWMYTTRLEYDQEYHYAKRTVFSRFVDKYLLSHQHPVLESLHFKFKTRYAYIEIGLWIRTALTNELIWIRNLLRDLGIEATTPITMHCDNQAILNTLKGMIEMKLPSTVCLPSLKTLHLLHLTLLNDESSCPLLSDLRLNVDVGIFGHISLPSVLFTCKKLVVLKLKGRIEVNVPSMICLPSLKTLHCFHLRLFNHESINRILSNCPLMSYLGLEHRVMSKLHIVMPWLQRLTIVTNSSCEPSPTLLDCYIRGLEIRTPSLKYLNIQDFLSKFCVRVRIRSLSNFEDTSIYRRIVYLELSMYTGVLEELLIYLLKSSMNLLVLKINSVISF
ncbi:unnamed protein product [Brassica oleracea]